MRYVTATSSKCRAWACSRRRQSADPNATSCFLVRIRSRQSRGTAFDLPFSIPDYHSAVKLYGNVDCYELDERSTEGFGENSQSKPRFTNVSYALHVTISFIYCMRRIANFEWGYLSSEALMRPEYPTRHRTYPNRTILNLISRYS